MVKNTENGESGKKTASPKLEFEEGLGRDAAYFPFVHK